MSGCDPEGTGSTPVRHPRRKEMKAKVNKMLADLGYTMRCIVMSINEDGYICFGYCSKVGETETYGFTAAETTLEWTIEILESKEMKKIQV
jgi:hypothetical protein